MNPLQHIVEPRRLLMTWQPSDENVSSRIRRVVGEISPGTDEHGEWSFKYVLNSADFLAATEEGFMGHPAFKLDKREYLQGVRETLLRRLPPRAREDFSDFLSMHRLPHPFPKSDLALIGYTGAKLPSDGFSFVPDFPHTQKPCEYILEVAGVRHNFVGNIDDIHIGDGVTFCPEPTNKIDGNAIFVQSNGKKLGYVNRAMLDVFNYWLSYGTLNGRVERKNGKPERPLIYVRIQANMLETSEAVSPALPFSP